MILLVALAALAAPAPAAAPPPRTPTRARTQLLLAEWALAHGDREAAQRAAAVTLLHDRSAAAPQALLASLLPDDPESVSQAVLLLTAAAANPAASASVYTALGGAQARLGQIEAARSAFAQAEARGGASANYAAWVGALATAAERVEAAAVSARWQSLVALTPGGYALRATLVVLPDGAPADALQRACFDALAAARLQESIRPHTVAARCLAAGLPAVGLTALASLGNIDAVELSAARGILGGDSP